MKVALTERADRDLEEIAVWLLEKIGGRSLAYVQDLRKSCAALGDMPFRFPIVSTHPSLSARRRVHGNYLIFYVVEAGGVRVLRILHGARDDDAVMFPKD